MTVRFVFPTNEMIMKNVIRRLEMKGWVRLLNWRKFHWIEDGESLCGKWMYWGQDEAMFDGDITVKKGECDACRKKLDKRNGL